MLGPGRQAAIGFGALLLPIAVVYGAVALWPASPPKARLLSVTTDAADDWMLIVVVNGQSNSLPVSTQAVAMRSEASCQAALAQITAPKDRIGVTAYCIER